MFATKQRKILHRFLSELRKNCSHAHTFLHLCGGATRWRVCYQRGLSRLVFIVNDFRMLHWQLCPGFIGLISLKKYSCKKGRLNHLYGNSGPFYLFWKEVLLPGNKASVNRAHVWNLQLTPQQVSQMTRNTALQCFTL